MNRFDQGLQPPVRRSFWRRAFPFLRWWGFIGRDTLRADLVAGLTGAVIVLPQGVAFAMIAGLPPEYGLYTAIVTPIVAALFGSSLHLVSGPTTAISIVVLTSVSPLAEPGSAEYVRMVLTLTFLTGAYQLAFGLARLGALVNFASHSVVVGFTSGAAILIATSQLKHILGIELPAGHSFVDVWAGVVLALPRTHLLTLGVAAVTVVSAVLFKLARPRWPGLLFAMIIGSLACWLVDGAGHGVHLLGRMPANLPPPSLPDFSFETIRRLAPKALAVALLGLIEAVSVARAVAARSGQPIDGNQEFIGQGLSNIAGSFFSSYAGSGSFTRSGVNYHAGGLTPLSAVFSAVLLAAMLLFIAPLSAYLPIAAMGGIILLAAYSLIDLRQVRTIVKTSGEDTAVMLTTFLATLFLDLEFAIYAGVLLSLLLFLNRTAHPQITAMGPNPDDSSAAFVEAQTECPSLSIIRIDGPLFFGSVNHVGDYLYNIDKQALQKRIVVILGCGINFIDVAGAELLAGESARRRAGRGNLYLCELNPEALHVLERGGHLDAIGRGNVFDTLNDALATISPALHSPQCRDCTNPILKGCAAKAGSDREPEGSA